MESPKPNVSWNGSQMILIYMVEQKLLSDKEVGW